MIRDHRMMNKERESALIQQGRNQVLYLLLCIGDDNVAHDHWHPDKAHFLYETRKKILHEIRDRDENLIGWPKSWPDFENYTYTPG